MNELLKIAGVSKRYPGGKHPALRGVDLQVEPSQFVVIVGPSGSGKSTLIEIIAGLEQADSGTLEAPSNISMVFQSGALFPWLTASQNVEIALRARSMSAKAIGGEARKALHMVGLSEFGAKLPRELSGGQRQRVGLARALAVDPQLLILDEPFSALDIQTTEFLHRDLLRIWRETKPTVLMVSHSIEEAVTLADRVILIKAGQIAGDYQIDIKRPRREQQHEFIRDVQKIREDLLN